MILAWYPPLGAAPVQLFPRNTAASGVVRDVVDMGTGIAMGRVEWQPFLDAKPAEGLLYRGGILGPRGGILVPILSLCGTWQGILDEINALDAIFSEFNGLGVLEFQSTRTRRHKCYLVGSDAFYASPDAAGGGTGNLAAGQLYSMIELASPSPYWYEDLAELESGTFVNGDTLTIANDSGVKWGVYVEATPTALQTGLTITNETTGRIWSSFTTVAATDVLKVDWYGTDDDALSVTVDHGATEDDAMPYVMEFSDLFLAPGDNTLKFNMPGSWSITISAMKRYKSV